MFNYLHQSLKLSGTGQNCHILVLSFVTISSQYKLNSLLSLLTAYHFMLSF